MIDQDFLEVKKENKNNPNKNIIAIIVLVMVLLVGGFFVFKNKAAQKPEEEKREQKIKNVVTPEVIRISEDNLQKEMSAGFPKDIPLNGRIGITGVYSLNYQNTNNNQKVINFDSSKSVKENFDFYKNWAEKNDWRVMHSIISATDARLILEKDKKYLNIMMQKDSNNEKISKITMSF